MHAHWICGSAEDCVSKNDHINISGPVCSCRHCHSPSLGESISPPLESGDGSVIALTDRMWQKWRCLTSKARLWKAVWLYLEISFPGMLTPGSQPPHYAEALVTGRGLVQVWWLIAQLRSQLTISINCQISDRMSFQMIPASSVWATLADAAWSRGTYLYQARPEMKICKQNKNFFKPLGFWATCHIVITARREVIAGSWTLRLWSQISWVLLCHLFLCNIGQVVQIPILTFFTCKMGTAILNISQSKISV